MIQVETHTMKTPVETARHRFERRLEEPEAKVDRRSGSRAGIRAGTVHAPIFSRSDPRAKTLAEYNDWMAHEKVVCLITAHILHDVPTGVMYEEVAPSLEN
jgi:hypothetical protein